MPKRFFWLIAVLVLVTTVAAQCVVVSTPGPEQSDTGPSEAEPAAAEQEVATEEPAVEEEAVATEEAAASEASADEVPDAAGAGRRRHCSRPVYQDPSSQFCRTDQGIDQDPAGQTRQDLS